CCGMRSRFLPRAMARKRKQRFSAKPPQGCSEQARARRGETTSWFLGQIGFKAAVFKREFAPPLSGAQANSFGDVRGNCARGGGLLDNAQLVDIVFSLYGDFTYVGIHSSYEIFLDARRGSLIAPFGPAHRSGLSTSCFESAIVALRCKRDVLELGNPSAVNADRQPMSDVSKSALTRERPRFICQGLREQ